MIFLAINSYGQDSLNFIESEFNESSLKKFKSGDKQGAIIEITKAIEIQKKYNPDSSLLSAFYFFRGRAKFDLKDFRGANLDLTEGINLFSEKILINNNFPSVPLSMLSSAYYDRAYASIN